MVCVAVAILNDDIHPVDIATHLNFIWIPKFGLHFFKDGWPCCERYWLVVHHMYSPIFPTYKIKYSLEKCDFLKSYVHGNANI